MYLVKIRTSLGCVFRMQCSGLGGGEKGGGGEEFEWRLLVFKSAESLVFFLPSDTRMTKNKISISPGKPF